MRLYHRLWQLALVLSLAMTVLSAWIRLSDSGIDCAPWPACFGTELKIDKEPGVAIATEDPHRGPRLLHRVMASTFATLVMVLALVALWYRRRSGLNPLLPVICFAITVVLSIVGIRTPDLGHPIITVINLSGGMLLVAVIWQLILGQRSGSARLSNVRAPRSLVSISVIAVLLAIVTGAWVSGNFAAGSCDGFLSCHREGEVNVVGAFAPGRELEIEHGRVIPGADQGLIAYVHQWFAVAAVLAVAATVTAVFAGQGFDWSAVVAGLLTFFLVTFGIRGSTEPSVTWASLHNSLSVALLLTLIYLLNRLKPVRRHADDD